jgi:hypothetical protein
VVLVKSRYFKFLNAPLRVSYIFFGMHASWACINITLLCPTLLFTLTFGRDLRDSAIRGHAEYKPAYSSAFTIYSHIVLLPTLCIVTAQEINRDLTLYIYLKVRAEVYLTINRLNEENKLREEGKRRRDGRRERSLYIQEGNQVIASSEVTCQCGAYLIDVRDATLMQGDTISTQGM